jgi:UDP-4-amino-4,6-dideoxy-N-acetyl-beta-L-altrosamine transaminase
VAQFEQTLADYCGAKYAVAVNSGTSALHIAALAAGVQTGDVGITTPITFVASANCIAYCGGTPYLVDIDPNTANLDANLLEAACAEHKPKVIIPVDFTGQPADLPQIYEIAQRYGALVIEDAAHSLGATYTHEGEVYRAGSCVHADMAILSFHPVKHITTGEGGAVLTNDDVLYQKLLEFRTHGITKDADKLGRNDGSWYYEQQSLGLNYRLTDFQSALGLSQMRKLDDFVSKRRELVRLYEDALKDVKGVRLLTETEGKRSSYHLLVALIEGGADRRRELFDYFQTHNIRAQVHYIPVHFQPWHQESFGFREGDFPNAERYYEGCISLPLFPAMVDQDVERVASVLKQFLRQ